MIKFSSRMNLLKGSAIRELLALANKPEVLSFAGGMPAPELFPVDKIKAATDAVLEEQGRVALQYSSTNGFEHFRQQIADRMEAKLNIKTPDVVEPATNCIDEYIKIISKLMDTGYAYFAGGNVYIDTSKLERYYIFKHFNADDLDVAERLRNGRIEALAQIALNIADGNKQRNFRGIRVLQENLLLNNV